MEDGKVVIGTELDTKSFEKEIEDVKFKLDDIEATLQMASKDKTLFSTSEIKEMELEAEKLKNKLVGLQKKQADLDKPNTGKILDYLKNMGKETENNIKKVGRWALAIFGIRTVFGAVSSAMSTISSNDEQLKADIDYMKNAIAYTLEPVVRSIVNLMKQLMFYVGYIIKAWTGKNIFANANKSLKNATGSAKSLNKELNKTLAGFDEMNVLNDSSSGGGGGDSGGVTTPSFDLTNLDDIPIPSWLQWIVDHKEEVIAGLVGIAGALVALKLGLDPLMSLGIGLALGGIVYTIMSLLDYLKDPTWENFGKVIQGIGIAIVGLGIIIGSVPLIVAGAIVLIVGTIIKYWEQIKAFLQKGIDWLTSKSEWIHKTFGDTIGNIYDFFVRTLQRGLNYFDTIFKTIKGIFDGIIMFIKGVFTGNWKQAWEGVKKIFSSIWEGIKRTFSLFISGIIDKVSIIGSTVGDILAGAFKAVVNGVLGAIESTLNTPIRAVNKLISVINSVPGINLGKLSTFKLPRLAKGGIINMPGSGVMVGSAIGGERGAEGVIPLTDSQQMALLGEAIGKYITVNANITNTMNGRVISRELQRINNESDFAYNR